MHSKRQLSNRKLSLLDFHSHAIFSFHYLPLSTSTYSSCLISFFLDIFFCLCIQSHVWSSPLNLSHLLQLEWGGEQDRSGVTTSPGSESNSEKAPSAAHRRDWMHLQCSWSSAGGLKKLWTNRERSNQSSYFLVQTPSKNDCLLFHLDHTVCDRHDV